MERYSQPIIWLIFILFFSIQLFIQGNGIIAHDIIWNFEVGSRLVAGGSYAKDFFEPNPPLLFFLHGFLGQLAAKVHIKPITFFYVFLTISSLLSFFTCHRLITHIFARDKPVIFTLSAALIIAFSIAIGGDFGQKEHIVMLFALPYFFLNIGYLFEKNFSRSLQIVLGCAAGIGFAFKPPYFFLPLVLIELALMAQRCKINTLLRWDLVCIGFVQIIYLASIYLFTPSYLETVLPMILKTYAHQRYVDTTTLVTQVYMVFFYINLIGWLSCYTKDVYNKLVLQFFLISLGFALSYCLQGKGWTYQGLPLHVSNLFFFATIVILGLRKYKAQWVEKGLLCLSASLLFLLFYMAPCYQTITTKLSCFKQPQCGLMRMMQGVSQLAPKGPLFVFSTHMQSSYFRYYGGFPLGSRFPYLWPLPGYLNQKHDALQDVKQQIQTMITEDFLRFQPTLVLIHRGPNDYIHNQHFDYLTFMTENHVFSVVWKDYRWIEQINEDPYFNFDVYLKKAAR